MKALFQAAAAVGAMALLATTAMAAEDALPTLKSAWKLDLPAGTKRVAFGDVTGDKTLRLLTLDSSGSLTVHKMGDAGPVKEDVLALGAGADQFAVGPFTKDKSTVIVVPGSVFYRDGDKYAKKAAPEIKKITGSVRWADGTENYIVFDQGPPVSFGIDLSADNPVKPGKELPQPDQKPEVYRDLSPTLPPGMLDQAPFPEEFKKGSILRMFVPEKSKKVYVLVSWQGASSHLALLNAADIFTSPSPDVKPTWKSPALAGKILDIVFGNSVKDAKQNGVYVLEQTGDDGKGRQLEFFSLDVPAAAKPQ